MKMKSILAGYYLSIFLLIVTLLAAFYLTLHNGFKPGIWILSMGLFFAVLYFNNLKNK